MSLADGPPLLRLVRIGVGGSTLVAVGDPRASRDRERLAAGFAGELARGGWAAVPRARLDGGCRPALRVHDLSEVPRGAREVRFFPGPRPPA